jgi:hypothetical protein
MQVQEIKHQVHIAPGFLNEELKSVLKVITEEKFRTNILI